MKDSTRAKSSKQEKRIAKAIGGRQVVGSGSNSYSKRGCNSRRSLYRGKNKDEP